MIYGVLGLGSIGARHALNLVTLGQKVLAFDPSNHRLKWARDNHIESTRSRDEIFDHSAAIIVCSPNQFHFQDLRDAIESGCHVFMEKPLAHTARGVKSLLGKADEKGLNIFSGLVLRFHPAVAAAKILLDDLAIGTPNWAIFQSSHYLPNWRPNQNYRSGYTANPATGGVLFDIIHEFDLANHLLGPAKTLLAASRNTGVLEIESEDCADVVLTHGSGLHSILHLDYVTRPTRRWSEIGGSEGILKLDLIKRQLTRFNLLGEVVQEKKYQETNSNDDYLAEMSAFVECVNDGKRSIYDGHAALDVLKQVLVARKKCGLPFA